jgi:hypothetical protein
LAQLLSDVTESFYHLHNCYWITPRRDYTEGAADTNYLYNDRDLNEQEIMQKSFPLKFIFNDHDGSSGRCRRERGDDGQGYVGDGPRFTVRAYPNAELFRAAYACQ